MVGALRAFFRFLRLQGLLDLDFSAAVPSAPHWRLQALPASLQPHQVNTLFKQCDRQTPVGRRDFAILRLMIRLGLRSGEVASLTLDDIDWPAGEISVRGKGNRQHRLPLPQDVGEALIQYLKRGRPRCASRRLFIRARAPYTGLKNNGCVSTRVKCALIRAGLHSPRQGSHLLRHTAATLMLRRGASLFEIGQILNHRHPDATAIYAKVDLAQLRPLAQRWPGGSR
jgi:site-specific recombinase XerD